MRIGLIPKKQIEAPPWQTALFVFSAVFLILSLLVFALLARSAKKTSLEIESINQELAKDRTQAEIDAEKEVLISQKKIVAFGILLNQRKQLSRVFDLIEKLVHPEVVFSKMGFTVEDNTVWLSGKADNFQALGQQSLLFKTQPLIKESNLMQVGIGKHGGVEFGFKIIFDPQFFKVAE
ncbi:MAG: hypothetical protein Q8N16_04290 [bacterium]|nr:hypothetical protein [bacterium]